MTTSNHDEPAAGTLASRVILVTGASGGLGRVASLALAGAGATVLLLGRNERRLDAVYDEIVAAQGPTPMVVTLDLAAQQDAQFEALASAIEAQFGRLDGIAHLAGQFVQLAPIAQQRLPDWEKAFAVNILAPFALTRACLPLLTRAPDASVLFCCEAHTLAPAAFWGGFAASQAALPGLVRTLSEEFPADPGPRFNLLIPGPIETPMRERTHPGETRMQRRPPAELAELLVRWLGPASRGRSGDTVRA